MHLKRVLIVVEQRTREDGTYPGFDTRHMEGPLQYGGMVENIDVFYYWDYLPSCDEALINYCLEKKPQAVLLSLQNMSWREGAPTPDAIRKITHQLGIPTVMFWFDIHSDRVAEVLERYLHAVTLNMILGADGSSHKNLPLDGINYIYAGLTFDERVFNIPEGVRDIPVGFIGSLNENRSQWIAGLSKSGIQVYTAGGYLVRGNPTDLRNDKAAPIWLPYEEHLKLMSRLRITLNFSLLGARPYDPVLLSERGRALEALHWFASRPKTWALKLAKNPTELKHGIRVLHTNVSLLLRKPRYMVRARVWEGLWCRTFLLEEDNPVTSVFFEPFSDYVPFTTLRDLVDKIRYYLENEDERDAIRRQGHETVGRYYNARMYWEAVFETIGLESASQPHHPGEVWDKDFFAKRYPGQV